MGHNLNLKLFAKDSFLNLIRQTMVIVVGLVTSTILARGLGVEDRGIYALALLLPSLLVVLLNSGFQSAIIYYVASNEYNLGELIGKNIALSMWISVIAIALGGLVIGGAYQTLFPGVPVEFLVLSLLIAPITLFKENLTAAFQGLQHFRIYNLIEIIPQIGQLIFVLIMVYWLKSGVLGALIAIMMGRLAALTVCVMLIKRQINRQKVTFVWRDWSYNKRLLSYGGRAHISYISNFLNYRIDIFLLNLITHSPFIGLYDVGVTLVERLWMISQSVNTVAFPRIVASKDGEVNRKQLTVLVFRYVLWFSSFAAFFSFVLGEWIVVLLYGQEFRYAAVAFRLLIPGIMILGIARVAGNDTAGRGKPGINAVQSILSVAVNIILNLVLIPKFDFLGAAIATTISYSMLGILFVYTFCKNTDTNWRELVLPTREDVRRLYRLTQYVLRHKSA